MTNTPHQQLLSAAKELGLEVSDLSPEWGEEVLAFFSGPARRFIFNGKTFPGLGYQAEWMTADPWITNAILTELEIPVPPSARLWLEDDQVQTSTGQDLAAILEQAADKDWLLRPQLEADEETTLRGKLEADRIKSHLQEFEVYNSWVLQVLVEGSKFRIYAVKGEILAAGARSATGVTGDGSSSLEDLIEIYNTEAESSGSEPITIDGDTRQLLRDQDVFLSETVESGRFIQLKSGGSGEATSGQENLLPALASDYADWVKKLSEWFLFPAVMLEITTQDPSGKETGPETWISNVDPIGNWSEMPGGGEQEVHPLAKKILQTLFP